jgi:bacteriocin-like protein
MMTTQNQFEKGERPATSSPAKAHATAPVPSEIRELTDDELRAVSGGTSISNSGNGTGSKMK